MISKGTEAIQKYFEALPGSGRKNAITERYTIVLNDAAVVGTGLYTFTRAAGKRHPHGLRDLRCWW